MKRFISLTEEQYDRVLWALVVAGNTYHDRGNEIQTEKFYDLEEELRKTYGEPIDD